MTKLVMKAKEFKKMNDPTGELDHVKYVCYVQANTIPEQIQDWMDTNPRDQKMSTTVATNVVESIKERNDFHELNRGILISAEDVSYDNKKNIVEIEFTQPDIHGNIDGGHTLKAILENSNAQLVPDNRYVFFEIFTGISSPVELAAARNTSVQVDLKSIEELNKSFEILKKVMKPNDLTNTKDPLHFFDRIAFRMNENLDKNPIDVREIIAILNMFNQTIYPIRQTDGQLSITQPIQSYTGKETSLKRYLTMGGKSADSKQSNIEKRTKIIENMTPILPEIFELYDLIERDFPSKVNATNRKYGSKKYSKFDSNRTVGNAVFSKKDLLYLVPRGIIYPVLGSFRALVEVDEASGLYKWKENPIEVWEKLGSKLASTVMDEKEDNPEYIGKSSNLWSNLFKEVVIYVAFK